MSDLFTTYERVQTRRVEVATITIENIHLIARLVHGCVDYSSDPVAITEPDSDSKMRWKEGMTVQVLGGKLNNMNGFNRENDWNEVSDD